MVNVNNMKVSPVLISWKEAKYDFHIDKSLCIFQILYIHRSIPLYTRTWDITITPLKCIIEWCTDTYISFMLGVGELETITLPNLQQIFLDLSLKHGGH